MKFKALIACFLTFSLATAPLATSVSAMEVTPEPVLELEHLLESLVVELSYSETLNVEGEEFTLIYDWDESTRTTTIIHEDGLQEVVIFDVDRGILTINGNIIEFEISVDYSGVDYEVEELLLQTRTGQNWILLRTLPNTSLRINPVGTTAIAIAAAVGAAGGKPGIVGAAVISTIIYSNTRTLEFTWSNRRQYMQNPHLFLWPVTANTGRLYESWRFIRTFDSRF